MTKTNGEGLEKYISQSTLFWLASGASLFFSLGGIGMALMIQGHPGAVAERGGAIGSAITFLTMFAGRNYGDKLFRDSLDRRRPQWRDSLIKLVKGSPLTDEDRDWLIYALVGRQILSAAEQQLQNKFLVWVSIFSTAIWGFGGFVVSWLLLLFHFLQKLYR
jgi:hypothetical protein